MRNALAVAAVIALHAAVLTAIVYASLKADSVDKPVLMQAILENPTPSTPAPPSREKTAPNPPVKAVTVSKATPSPTPVVKVADPQPAPVVEAKMAEAAPVPAPAALSASKAVDSNANTAETSKSPNGHATPASAPKMVYPTTDADFLCAAPQYPAPSKRFKETGRVVISLLIDTNGRAAQASIKTSSGFARLDQAALGAAQKCRFKPGTRNGVPEAMTYDWPFNFNLTD